MKAQHPLIVILGPTASGKTKLAVSLAKKIGAEIISADSRQVYKGMDIGTGKDLNEYKNIPHHLIDIIPAGDQYDCAQFQSDFANAFKAISAKNKPAILCGGTGLYIQAVLQNFQHTSIPQNLTLRSELNKLNLIELKKRLEKIPRFTNDNSTPSSRKQLIRAIEIREWHNEENNILPTHFTSFPYIIFGLSSSVPYRREQISKRLKERIEEGLIEEVENLLKNGVSDEQLIHYGLEYKWATYYLRNEISYKEFYKKLETAIHQFAKRQMTYFRKMEKDGLNIHWISYENLSLTEKTAYIKEKVKLI